MKSPLKKMCPREELNLYHQLRRLVFYPLNYEDKIAKITAVLAALVHK